MRGDIRLPDRYNPWAPLDVYETPGFLTRFKMERALASPTACLAALGQTRMKYDVLPDRTTGPGCGFDNAVLLRSGPVRLQPAPALSCPMAVSFYMWERHVLQPAATRHLNQRVVALEHLGSYACRNINRGRSSGAMGDADMTNRSRHATANALDIAAFSLADGERVSIARDWPSGQPAPALTPVGRFLREAHQGGCAMFRGVLGPEYNAAHKDHFHLETGGFRVCR